MKRDEQALMSPERLDEARQLGAKLARLRRARQIRQAEAAVRAGLCRSTALAARQATQRVHALSKTELERLDF